MPKMRVEEVNACSEVRPVSKSIAQWTLIALIGCVRVVSEHKVDGRNLPLSEWGVTVRADLFSMDRPHNVVHRGEMGEVGGFRHGHSLKVGSGNGGLKVLS